MIELKDGIGISEHELLFSCQRSPGPGGQKVNKSNTRVTLEFNVPKSLSLTGAQRARVRQALANRISQEGILRIVSSKERTQLANRRAAVTRFIELMNDALDIPTPRKKTRMPTSARRTRTDTKTRRGQVKRLRQEKISPNGG